jgi:hypothetical protein
MTEMNKHVTTEVLLTSDDIRRWQDEIRQWEQAKAEADSHIADLRRKLEAAAVLSGTPTLIANATVLKSPDDGEQESMGAAAKRILGVAGVPLFHSQLQAELRKIERVREMLDRNNGAYYYTMINRLKKRSEVRKVGTNRIRLVHKDETPPEGNPEGAS